MAWRVVRSGEIVSEEVRKVRRGLMLQHLTTLLTSVNYILITMHGY